MSAAPELRAVVSRPDFQPSGSDVIALREHSGLSKGEFAELVRASLRTLQAWENDERNMPPLDYEVARLLIDYPEVRAALIKLHAKRKRSS